MRVAIIGGGMAGLSAAHELLRLGQDPVVFEAAARAGGKVGTVRERGWLTEDGPNFLARPLQDLLEATGLRGEVVEPAPPVSRWLHLEGRVLKAPSLGLLRKAGLGRALLEPLVRRPPGEDLPLREFLVRRLGRKAGRLAAAVMAAGVYAGDPSRLSAREAFPSLAEEGSLLARLFRRGEGRRIWSLRGGLGMLPQRLSSALGARLRLGVEVARLAPAWEVDGERFDAVIVAVPAQAAARLLRSFAPSFSDAAAQMTAAPIAVVHLGFPQRELPRGFGLIDADGSLHAVGTLLPSSMLPGRAPPTKALATALCGGALHPERAMLPDAQLIEAVTAELRGLFGVRSRPEYARVVRWPEAIPQVAPGHADRVRAARVALEPFGRIEIAGASWDGVSVPEVVQSGAAAARRAVARS